MFDRKIPKLVLFALIACVSLKGYSQVAGSTNEDSSAIRTMGQQWLNYWNSGNAEGLTSIYTSDAIWMDPLGPNIVGSEAIGQYFGEGYGQIGGTQSSIIEEVRVEGDLAYALGTWQITGGVESGASGEWLWVLNRQSGGTWLVSRHIANETIETQ